ncbi:TetR/AcrR family transcriptional regulator [Bacillus marinisedimentorum]|uniref:TetR/AcrR family transcriptional regulator n=1 Tax=Bacillus marinisedimentorum TaxID=1821260 RepID=UPI0007E215F3|nr:TetR family transcriptional regulator [Bacillus marinisedimentorum]
MPKPTFYNLKEEKKKTLIEAARKEFARVSLYEASISNILKTAGIPRGSFYQYFEDKEDAFFYLLNEHARERQEKFISKLKKWDGDLFEATIDLFQSSLEDAKHQNQFIKHVLLNMNYKIEHALTRFFGREPSGGGYSELLPLLDTEIIAVSTEEELFHAMQLIMAVTFHNLVYSIANELTTEDAMQKHRLEIKMLKAGLSEQPC